MKLHDNYQAELVQIRSLEEVQWGCINTLHKRYAGLSLGRGFDNAIFSDGIWPNKEELSQDYYWDSLEISRNKVTVGFNGNEFPLMLLCKISMYRQVIVLNSSESYYKACMAFYHFFKDLFRAKSILIGKEGDSFNPIASLTSDDITSAAQLHLAKTGGKLSDTPFRFLHNLKALPFEAIKEAPFFSITSELPWEIDGVSITTWLNQLKASENYSTKIGHYKPLDFEVVGEIVSNAMKWVDNHKMLADVFSMLKLYEDEYGEVKYTGYITSDFTNSLLDKYGVSLNELLPVYFAKKEGVEVISPGYFSNLMRLASGAATWIILLTTGLRNVDMRRLKVGCCIKSGRGDLLNYLITNIKKTKLVNYILPVPSQTKNAIFILETVRRDFNCQFLLTKTNLNSTVGKDEKDKSAYHSNGTLNNSLRDFLVHHNISTFIRPDEKGEATVHNVRATLAGWIGANSHMAILIVRKLFGHTNMLMPDAYLHHNPIIIKQRRENILKSTESLCEDMATGMVNGKLGGTKGKQMLRGAKHVQDEIRIESKSLSLTEMDMKVTFKERIKELLFQRMLGGEVFAMLTPMGVVCMRNCNDTSDSPCAKQANHEKRKDKAISKEITDALGTLPNPAHCVGKNCSDALFGEAWSQPLLETFQYYINYRKGLGDQSIDMKFEAEHFVREYGPILKELYEEEDCFV
jgi:hypothetical protein